MQQPSPRTSSSIDLERTAITEQGAVSHLDTEASPLLDRDPEPVLRISTTAAFATRWLAPRLHRFTALHPQTTLQLEGCDQMVALASGVCDIALRHGRIASGDAEIVYREQLVVVYSPALDGRPSATLAQLARLPLLCERTPELWLRLLDANQASGRRRDFSRSYSSTALLIQAAIAGAGVALVPYALVYDDILHDRLRMCACMPLASAYAYRLMYGPDQQARARVQGFTAWLHAEFKEMPLPAPPPVSKAPSRAAARRPGATTVA